METRKVLVADASPEFCSVLADMMDPGFQLRACHDGATALALLAQFQPDVLVVDLTLPGLDGLAVLKAAAACVPRPACLVTTRFLSSFIESSIAALGVDFVVMKPCDIRALADRILDLTTCAEGKPLPAPAQDNAVVNTLICLSVAAHRQGFQCLEEAIGMYLEKPGLSMTKELYPTLAQRHNGSPSSVERSIRSAIHAAWAVRDEEIWRLYFPCEQDGYVPRPSNSRFIASVAEYLRANLADLQ